MTSLENTLYRDFKSKEEALAQALGLFLCGGASQGLRRAQVLEGVTQPLGLSSVSGIAGSRVLLKDRTLPTQVPVTAQCVHSVRFGDKVLALVAVPRLPYPKYSPSRPPFKVEGVLLARLLGACPGS